MLYVGEGSEREQCHLLSSWLAFSHFPLLPTSKLGPSGADSWVGGLVYSLGPCGSLNKLSCEAGSFSCCRKLHSILPPEVLRLYCPHTGTLGCVACLTPQSKTYGHSERTPDMEVHSDAGLPKKIETFQINNLTLHLQEFEEQ